MINIQQGEKQHSNIMAKLIMQAMNYDCCHNFMGPGHSLEEFEQMLTDLVASDKSQYSYRNSIVALDEKGDVCGICVSYDGGQLHTLRNAFIKEMKVRFGKDYSTMDDETAAGEMYADSLAVAENMRGQGIATRLLNAVIDKARQAGLERVGLLVDKGNPDAERLYARIGF